MATYSIDIIGVTPLLTHNPVAMLTPQTTGKRGEAVYEPTEEAEKACYRLDDGTCGIPSIALRASILNASSAFKVPKKRYSVKSLLTHAQIGQELLPLLSMDGEPLSDYAIDQRRVIVNRAGVIRCRPRFDEWRVCCDLEYDESLIAKEFLEAIMPELLKDAGKRFGIGDYRPQKGGWFGQFAPVS